MSRTDLRVAFREEWEDPHSSSDSSINRPFLTKNNYSSQDPLYSFYMKYSVIENR